MRPNLWFSVKFLSNCSLEDCILVQSFVVLMHIGGPLTFCLAPSSSQNLNLSNTSVYLLKFLQEFDFSSH